MALPSIPTASHLRACWLALGVVASSTAAHATDEASVFRFNGFGTVGAAHSSERRADYVINFTHPTGAGFTGNWSPAVDSRIGLQGSADFGNGLTAVLQLVSEQQWDKRWTPQAEWANVAYAFTPDLSVRLGRTAVPLLLYSDIKAGYSIVPVRPSSIWYTGLPVSHLDGVDASWRTRFSGVTNTAFAYAGMTKVTLPDGSPEGLLFKAKTSYLLGDKIEIGDLTVTASYYDLPHLTTPKLRGIPVPFISRLADSPYKRTFLGVQYNPGQFFVNAEGGRDWSELVGDRTGAVVTAGYRFGQLTPFVRLEKVTMKRVSPLFTNQAGTAAAAGVRWDLARNLDLKLQVDRIRPKDTPFVSSPIGALTNAQPGFRTGVPFTVLSVAVDFLF